MSITHKLNTTATQLLFPTAKFSNKGEFSSVWLLWISSKVKPVVTAQQETLEGRKAIN